MIELAKKKEPIHGRLVQYLLHDLLSDGGTESFFEDLFRRIVCVRSMGYVG